MALEKNLSGVVSGMPHHCSSALTSASTCISESEFPLAQRRVQKDRFWNEVVEVEVFGETMINMGRDFPIPDPCVETHNNNRYSSQNLLRGS